MRLLAATRIVPPNLYGARARNVMERSAFVARRGWLVFLTGFLEPLFYLLSLGLGLGQLVPPIPLGDGRTVSYAVFMAPAMLASSAMNAAVFEACINLFFKLKWQHTFTAMLATPIDVADVALGEIGWTTFRSALYSAAFLVLMAIGGLLTGWTGLLALPAALLLGLCFAAVGLMAASFMKTIAHMDLALVVVMPMFLFSGTFYPVSSYPVWLQWLVAVFSPLYHGVQLTRGAALGTLGWAHVGHVAYLLVLGLFGLAVGSRRLASQLRV